MSFSNAIVSQYKSPGVPDGPAHGSIYFGNFPENNGV
jgi:hypothetical protein